MSPSTARNSKNKRKGCSTRTKVTTIGNTLASTSTKSNISAKESASAQQLAAREWITHLRRQMRAVDVRRKEDEVRADGPGGLATRNAVYTAEDGMQQQYLVDELHWSMDSMAGEDADEDGNEDAWASEDEDVEDEDMEDTINRLAFLEKEVAAARLRAQTRQQTNKHWARYRTLAQSRAWLGEYERLTEALLRFEAGHAPRSTSSGVKTREVLCLSWEGRKKIPVTYGEDISIAEALVQVGYMPTVPTLPSLGIAIPVLAMYDIVSSRCASLSIQAFSHAWCDLQNIAFEEHFGHSFSGAFDAYLELRHRIKSQLDSYIYTTDLSRFQDVCPSCTYKLDGEPELAHSLLVSVDGNESLKRVRRMTERPKAGGGSEFVSCERPDFRHRQSFMRIEASEVDVMRDEVAQSSSKKRKKGGDGENGEPDQRETTTTTRSTSNGEPLTSMEARDDAAGEGCEEKWTNMSPDHKNAWGTFNENGVFVCACRHGCVLLRCDMIRSGELAKYPLAIVKRLTEVFGKGILCGYDIGCNFSKTAGRSRLVGPLVRENEFKFCCGLFHGYAHNRKCQLRWLPLYTKGAGLEDFETCERVFSDSNKVAAVTRNASAFHREQWLDRHYNRWNADKFAECSKFLVNNWKQALRIIDELEPELASAKERLGITNDNVFEEMREDELDYLIARQGMRSSETEEREIEYVQNLRKLQKCNDDALERDGVLREMYGSTVSGVRATAKWKADVRRTESQQAKMIDEVGAISRHLTYLETVLGIAERWHQGVPDYVRVSKLVDEGQYFKLMDRLEGLVVARLHELSKMNKAGTGVRLRVQIAKALDARGTAIRSAVKKFNAAGAKLGKDPVDAKDVLRYATLGEFDLLRLSRHDVANRAWANPAVRDAQAMFFKLERAREEIVRAKVEARRLKQHIVDWVHSREVLVGKLSSENPVLLPQLQRAVLLRLAHCERHFRRLSALGAECEDEDLSDRCRSEMEHVRERLQALTKDVTLPDRGKQRTADDLQEQADVEEEAKTDEIMGILASMPDIGDTDSDL